MIALAITLAGCDAPPPTNTDDVMDYVRNGIEGAKVRRLDPPAQEYVDAVFAAYTRWRTACASIEELADIDDFNPLGSDDWRELDKIKKILKTVRKFKADEPDPANEDAKTRAQWLDEIRSAVANVPDIPAGRTTHLPTRVSAVLGAGETSTTNDRLADDFETLFALIETNATDFDAKSTGLTFKSTTASSQAAAIWNRLHSALSTARQTERDELQATLTEGRESRDLALQQKRDLRTAGLTTEADKRSFRELEMFIQYYDTRIKNAETRQRELDPKTDAES